MRLSQINRGTTVLTNKSLAYGKLNAEYNAEGAKFFVNFTNEGLVVNFHVNEGHKEALKVENERLVSLGFTTKITGRKFQKIEIIF